MPVYDPLMCNRARTDRDPPTLFQHFGAKWMADKPIDNRFNPVELVPRGRNWIVHETDEGRGLSAMSWDVLAGQAPYPMTNIRNLALSQWVRLASDPSKRCLIPVTEFAEWTLGKHNLGDGKPPLKGEMWFTATDQPLFAIAGFWQEIGFQKHFAMVTCEPNELVAPIHPKAMVTILREEDWDRWLTGSYDDAVALQRPYPADRMEVRGPVFPTRQPPAQRLML